MSRWIQGVSSAELFGKHAAEIAPPSVPGIRYRNVDLMISCIRRRAQRHIFSPACLLAWFKAVVHLIVAGEDAGVDIAKATTTAPGERGGPTCSAAEFDVVAKSVGQHEPALGVGINDFDRLAGHRICTSPGFCLCPTACSRWRRRSQCFHLRLEQRDRTHDSDPWVGHRPCRISSSPCVCA